LEKEPLKTRKLRDRFCIIAEILVVAKDGSLKPQIMYRADLGLAQLNEYLSSARSLAQKKYDMLARFDRKEDY
jgi:predicted transcriptional regulator